MRSWVNSRSNNTIPAHPTHGSYYTPFPLGQLKGPFLTLPLLTINNVQIEEVSKLHLLPSLPRFIPPLLIHKTIGNAPNVSPSINAHPLYLLLTTFTPSWTILQTFFIRILWKKMFEADSHPPTVKLESFFFHSTVNVVTIFSSKSS